MAASQAGSLRLSGCSTLSDVAARHLASFGGDLVLSGLRTLSDVAAEHLSNFTGGDLLLDGLTDVTPVGAASLARCRNAVDLSKTVEAMVRPLRAPRPGTG